MYLRNMFQTFVEPKKENGLPYNVNKMTHEDFFYLKALSGSFGSDFSKTTENETVEMTDIETVKWTNAVPAPSPSKRPTLRKITKTL